MKCTRQHNGKTIEAPKRKNAKAGQTGIKRSTKRTCGQRKKGTGVGSAEQVSAQSSSSRDSSPQKTTELPALDVNTEQFCPITKIKLQLFPVDKQTRKGLERDGHNPYLELTLSGRKKISSILKHINTKWGTSNVALGEPVLFPYDMQLESLATERRWTLKDTSIRAGDVHAAMGCPAIFRLRYGWLPYLEPKASGEFSTAPPVGACLDSGIQGSHSTKTDKGEELNTNVEVLKKPINVCEKVDSVVTERMFMDVLVDPVGDRVAKIENGLTQMMDPWEYELTNLSIGGLLSEASLQGKIDRNELKSDRSSSILQPIQLISDVSVGGLLSEVSLQEKINNSGTNSNGCTFGLLGKTDRIDLKSDRSKSSLQPIQLVSDVSVGGLLSEVSLQEKINSSGTISNASTYGLLSTMNKGFAQLLVPWDESCTTLSIGGLLSEASLQGKISNADPKSNGSRSGLLQTSLTSDSFDAFAAGQFYSCSQAEKPLSHNSHSSILDAEETCHAFAFWKSSLSSKGDLPLSERARSRSCSHDSNESRFMDSSEDKSQAGLARYPCQKLNEGPLHCLQGVYKEESSLGLTGIKWNDTFGPLDLAPSTSQQIAVGDSISINEVVR